MKTSGLETLSETERKFVQFQCLGAKINFDKFGELLPVIITLNFTTSEIKLIGMAFETEAEKMSTLKRVRDTIIEQDVDAVMTIMESWYLANLDVEDFIANRDKWRSVKEHPASREAVMFTYENKSLTLHAKADIVPSNRKTILEAKFEPSKVEGIFSQLVRIKEAVSKVK